MFYKTTILFIILISLYSCGSSKETYLLEFNTFIADLEVKADVLTEEQWQEVEKQYNRLIAVDFEKVKSKLTSDEMNQIGRLKGKYTAIKLKKESNDLIKEAKDALNQTKGVVEGVLESINN